MDRELILGVDQGSGSTKAVLMTLSGKIVKEFVVRIDSTRTMGSHVEQNPEELYLSVKNLIDEAFAFVRPYKAQILGIGLAFQRSGVCAWDSRTGEPLHALITWADTRTAEALKALGGLERVTEKTSLPVTPHYAAPKIALLQQSFPEETSIVGTLDTFVLHRLSGLGELATESTMASRTMLYDMSDLGWDQELCEIFGVEISRLPPVRPSFDTHMRYQDVPVVSMLGDQQASLFGRLGPAGYPVLNMGTVSSLCVPLGDQFLVQPGYVSSILCSRRAPESKSSVECLYLMEALTNASGSVIEHIRKMRYASSLAQVSTLCELEADSDTVVFLPLGGTGSPSWRYGVPGYMRSWDGTNTAALVHALVENIGAFISENVLDMSAAGLLGHGAKTLTAAGGVSEIDPLLQYVADCTGFEINRMASKEASARGSAIAALMSLGLHDNPAELNEETPDRVFAPRDGSSALERFAVWRELRDCALEGKAPVDSAEYDRA